MSYSYQEIELATSLMRILGIILFVAIAAFFLKSRLIFVCGVLGSLLGFLVPEPKIYAQYSSAEGAFLGAIHDHANHILEWGIVGAIFGISIGILGAVQKQLLIIS
jgi:hypothetical protein